MRSQIKVYTDKIYFILLLLIALLIPTVEASSVKLASFSIILLTFWWLISGDYELKFFRFKTNKLIWLFTALFLINLVSLLRTYHLSDATNLLTRKLALFLLPLIIGTSAAITKKQVNYLVICFICSLFVASIFTFREGLTIVLDRVDLTNLVRLVLIHRPYFGLFSAFAVIGLFHLFTVFPSTIVRGFLLLALLYFLWFIYVLYAKMTVLALAALVVVLLAVLIAKKINLYVTLALGLCVLLTAYMVIRTNNSVRVIYDKIINFEDFSYQEYNIHLVSSINIRYINWGCSVKVLEQDQNWIAGLGIGNAQEQLNLCYKNLNPWIYEGQQNAHNEYLEEMLRNGVVGLGIFILCLFIPVGISLNQNNYFYLSFLILFAICCITEDYLSRQGGVLFYAFFNSVFAFNTFGKLNKKTISEG